MFLKYYQKIDDAISYLFSSVSNESKFIKSIFGKKKILYIDIGTNEGNYIDFLKKICVFNKVICFEPIEHLSKKLQNKYPDKNFFINNFALSNKVSSKKFYQYQISSQSSFYKQNNLFKSLKKLEKVQKIKTKKFDGIFSDNKKIDFCKIDVQGEELNVLKGMVKNLKKGNIRLIKIEISFIERYLKSKSNFYEILNFFLKYRYRLSSISKIKYRNNRLLLMDAFFEKT